MIRRFFYQIIPFVGIVLFNCQDDSNLVSTKNNLITKDKDFENYTIQKAMTDSILFSDYYWKIKSGYDGPGPNYWNGNNGNGKNVWKDQNGLHLKITKDPKNSNKWYCAEVFTTKRLGFGEYQFNVIGQIDKFDTTIVFGMFNYPTPDIGPDQTNEIDIEIARWGKVTNPNGNFSIWPTMLGLIKNNTYPFNINLNKDLQSTHMFTWDSRQIYFKSSNSTGKLKEWTFTCFDYYNYIPQNPMPVHLNLWLYNGNKPINGEVEVIIKSFTFTPKNTAPCASFTIQPSSGNTSTNFSFDASGSSDAQDPVSSLQVRWDWKNDGNWTNFSTTKTAKHKYSTAGTYTVKMEVKDTGGLTNTTTKPLVVSKVNTAPTASFTIQPSSGNTSTNFSFDASGSSDAQDPVSSLQVRWDWNNDGTWDTNYSTTKTAKHIFSTAGTYTIKLDVKDTGGLTNTTTKPLVVSKVNTAPTASFTIQPSSGNTSTNFSFDASGSSDAQDPVSSLQVRWDWTNDGIWDTNSSTTKTAKHQYSTAGTYTVKMEVKDTGGLISTTTRQLSVTNGTGQTGTVTDIDGNVYRTVKIGNQWWMAENLKVTHYRNGNVIPNVTDINSWINSTTGAYCNYNNDINQVSTYGRLYNWYTVNDSRKIAPVGWHVPSKAEWTALVDYLGGSDIAGGKIKETGTSHWKTSNTGVTNEYSFTALPGGYRTGGGNEGCYYASMGQEATFWSSTEYSITNSWELKLNKDNPKVTIWAIYKPEGFSVRCIKD